MRNAPTSRKWDNEFTGLKYLKSESFKEPKSSKSRSNVVASQSVPKFLQNIIGKNARAATQLPNSMQKSTKEIVDDAEEIHAKKKETEKSKTEGEEYNPVIANIDEFEDTEDILKKIKKNSNENQSVAATSVPFSISDQCVDTDTHSAPQVFEATKPKTHVFKSSSKRRNDINNQIDVNNRKKTKIEMKVKTKNAQLSFEFDDG